MRDAGDWTAAVQELLAALQGSDVVELRYRRPGLRVRLRRQPDAAVPPASHPSAAPVGEAYHAVLAPLTGVFYRAPAPEAEPYVAVGEPIEAGRVVGLIEAMKVFNEVQADAGGCVARVLVESGSLVQQGEPLLLLDPPPSNEESA